MTLLVCEKLEEWIAEEFEWSAPKGTHANMVLQKLLDVIRKGTFTAQAEGDHWAKFEFINTQLYSLVLSMVTDLSKTKEAAQADGGLVPQSILNRYEDMRQQCLSYGGIGPSDKSVCHQALRKVRHLPGLTYQLAALCDDMFLALNTRPSHSGWIPVSESTMPKRHQPVALLDINRYQNCHFELNIQDVGYLEGEAPMLYWAIRGERAQELHAYTHYYPLPPSPEVKRE